MTSFGLAPLSVAIAVAIVPAVAYSQLEEIVVTAQRRETSLQSTPISIQALVSMSTGFGRNTNGGAVNLTDEFYVNGGFDTRAVWGYDFTVIGQSREVGVSMGFAF